jgi:hypothetical protein
MYAGAGVGRTYPDPRHVAIQLQAQAQAQFHHLQQLQAGFGGLSTAAARYKPTFTASTATAEGANAASESANGQI